MTFDEIQTRLAAMEKSLADRGFAPFYALEFKVRSDGASIFMSTGWGPDAPKLFKGETYKTATGGTPAEVFAKAEAILAALPDPGAAKKQEALTNFGRAIDGLIDAGFETEIVTPAQDAMKAMTENLLTHQRT